MKDENNKAQYNLITSRKTLIAVKSISALICEFRVK